MSNEKSKWHGAVCPQVVDAANAAHERSQGMEEECHALHEENQRLQSVVRRLEVEVSELQADVETRGSALESLEQTLGKIERSGGSGRDRSPLTGIHALVICSSLCIPLALLGQLASQGQLLVLLNSVELCSTDGGLCLGFGGGLPTLTRHSAHC